MQYATMCRPDDKDLHPKYYKQPFGQIRMGCFFILCIQFRMYFHPKRLKSKKNNP